MARRLPREPRSSTLATYARLLRTNRNFRRLWIAQIISEIGDWFYTVALYTMLLEFTGRAGSLGLAFTLQVLPQALTGPLAGVINDRLPRKQVMIATDLARAVIIACMLFVGSPAMTWLIYPLLVSETVMWGLFEPARTSVVPNIVAEDEVMAANTLSSSTWSMNFFIGSALGGAVAVWLGTKAVFALDAASFLASAWLIAGMRFAEPHTAGAPPFRWRDLVDYAPLAEGMRYVREKHLTSTLFVKAGLGLTGASWVFFPVLAKDVFPIHASDSTAGRATLLGMSALMGARGLGSLLGPLAGGAWARQVPNRLRLGILAGFVSYGAGFVALAVTRNPALAYGVIVVSHMGSALGWVFSTTLLQLRTEDRLRGRIFSAELAFCTATLAASAYFAGLALDGGVGVRTVIWWTGVLTIVAGVWWAMVGLKETNAAGPQKDGG
jgi:predicted MFS family arabinose efflux permease